MKKVVSLLLSISLCVSLLVIPLPVSASNVVTSGTLTHTHVGSEGTTANGCYTVPISSSTGVCTPKKSGAMAPTTWACGGCGKTVTYQGYYVSGECGQGHGIVYKTSSPCTCTASNNSEDGLPGQHTYTVNVYGVGCGLTTCDYVISKTKVEGGTEYRVDTSVDEFIVGYEWTYYEKEQDIPVCTVSESSCVVDSIWESGTLYLTLTDAQGVTYTVNGITVVNKGLAFVQNGTTFDITELYFDDVLITQVYLNGVLAWSAAKEPIYWIQGTKFLGNGFPTSITMSGSASGTTTVPEVDSNATTESNGATTGVSAVVDTRDYKFITVTCTLGTTHGTNSGYTDPGRLYIYSGDGEELFYANTSGTYTVDIRKVDTIYIKLFAGAWAWNGSVARIGELYFHDK